MVDCDRVLDLISRRLDEPLSAGEQALLDSHLVSCESCRTLSQDLNALSTALSLLSEIPAPEGFADRVLSRIREETQEKAVSPARPPSRRTHWKHWAAMAACFVLIGGTAYRFGLWPTQNGSASGTSEADAGVGIESISPAQFNASGGESCVLPENDPQVKSSSRGANIDHTTGNPSASDVEGTAEDAVQVQPLSDYYSRLASLLGETPQQVYFLTADTPLPQDVSWQEGDGFFYAQVEEAQFSQILQSFDGETLLSSGISGTFYIISIS